MDRRVARARRRRRVSDTVAVRVAANYSHYRGNILNLTTGNWQNGTTDYTVRSKIAWSPTDRFTATLSPYYTKTEGTCCAPGQYLLSPGVTFSRANPPASTILAGITPGKNNRLTRLDLDTEGFAEDSSDFDFSALTVGGVNFATAPKGGVRDGGSFNVKTIT